MTDDELAILKYDWLFWARPNQLAPLGLWRIWLILAGRGYGKTRVGAEWIIGRAKAQVPRLHLLAETSADARDVMVEGVSGILACSPPDFRPHYEPSKRRLTWPNGTVATTFSADKPDQLRGPQCYDGWADELAKFRYADAWDQFELGLRLGPDPRAVVTTTPRPTKQIRDLVDDPDVHVSRGSTFDNAANLSPAFITRIRAKYEGTRLGRQELYAEILDDAPGALWKRDWLDGARVTADQVPDLVRIGVAVDPSFSGSNEACEAGIVAGGVCGRGHLWILGDESGRMMPLSWARKAWDACTIYDADRLVVEMNMGGDMVTQTLRTAADGPPPVRIDKVRATRGKATRAEPISALYEQGKVHHVGTFPQLEDQLCTWEPDTGMASPDRLDALVWLCTWLNKPRQIGAYGNLRHIRGPSRRV